MGIPSLNHSSNHNEIDMSEQEHWDTVYQTKKPEQVGWTQSYPEDSIKRIEALKLSKSAAIIDIGGGDSDLASILLDKGYTNITVLDISSVAIERAKIKLGKRANEVHWIVSDIRKFKPKHTYELWHDRAAFHFLVEEQAIQDYVKLLEQWATSYAVIGAFSTVLFESTCFGIPTFQVCEFEEIKMPIVDIISVKEISLLNKLIRNSKPKKLNFDNKKFDEFMKNLTTFQE